MTFVQNMEEGLEVDRPNMCEIKQKWQGLTT